MLNNITYALYLSLGIPVVFLLGRHLHHEGAIFFEGLKHFKKDEIKRYNNLLLIGFYLLNMGYTVFTLAENIQIHHDYQVWEVLSGKLGQLLLILGTIHYANMLILWMIAHKSKL